MIYALIFAQFVIVLAAAPLMLGLVRKFKAAFQNRVGAPVLLPYWSLASLMKKEMTITRHSSWVFRAVPFVVFGSALALALLMPTLAFGLWSTSVDNLFLITGILMLGAVFLVLGGMDTASTFGNMGSSREMTLASLTEPAFFMVIAALGIIAGTWSAGGIVAHFSFSIVSVAYGALTLAALLLIVLAENARYPVDNPATHLELTMVHEAMVLEYSGPYLALLEYASMVKLLVLSLFLANLLVPLGFIAAPLTAAGVIFALLIFMLKLVGAAFVIAFIESTIVKMRFYRMQEYMTLAFLLGLFGLVLAFATYLV
jgi:formate hydrogenlyase subunit 4